jgi:hypothetical protein
MLIILVMEPGTYATYAGFEDVADVRISGPDGVNRVTQLVDGELVRGTRASGSNTGHHALAHRVGSHEIV